MRKCLITIITILLMFPIATAIIDCQGVIIPNEVECMIISTWSYNDCNSTQAKIYNSTPTLTSTKNFTDYIGTGKCNFTWNISTKGSYIWNVSNGDTGRITVEVDTKMNIAIAIALSIFAALFIIIGTYLLFIRKQGGKDK